MKVEASSTMIMAVTVLVPTLKYALSTCKVCQRVSERLKLARAAGTDRLVSAQSSQCMYLAAKVMRGCAPLAFRVATKLLVEG